MVCYWSISKTYGFPSFFRCSFPNVLRLHDGDWFVRKRNIFDSRERTYRGETAYEFSPPLSSNCVSRKGETKNVTSVCSYCWFSHGELDDKTEFQEERKRKWRSRCEIFRGHKARLRGKLLCQKIEANWVLVKREKTREFVTTKFKLFIHFFSPRLCLFVSRFLCSLFVSFPFFFFFFFLLAS